MTWEDALEEVIRQTSHARYRELCANTWPDHPAYRQLVVRKALGLPEEPMQAASPPIAWAPGCGTCGGHIP